MKIDSWRSTALPGAAEDPAVWELFHENSKTGRYDDFPPQELIRARMDTLHQTLPYDQYPAIALPPPLALPVPVTEAIRARESARAMEPCRVSLEQVATLLHCAYGITRDNEGTMFPRPFRTVPSGGALYPLEIYFHSAFVTELRAGLYHFDPLGHQLRRLREADETRRLAEGLVQPNVASESAIVFFLTAVFERSTFKYGARGYRFVLLEAGHVAQNLNLVATALDLAVLDIGGYFDREVDALLGLDGIEHSTIYLVALGRGQAPGEGTTGNPL
jgi:SagB-type dehydrogenase family enzyme